MSGAPAIEKMLARVLAGSYDWSAADEHELAGLPAAAAEHGVEALLWKSLSGDHAGGAVREGLTPIARAAVAREVFVQQDLRLVTSALAAEGVAVLITKGSALAYTMYAEPWLRPRVDTDLLVRFGDLAAATRVVERCGYTRSDAISTGALVSHQVAFERTDGHGLRHVIDLHWKIANPQVVADALPFDDLWRSSHSVPALGPAARVPDPVGSIAIACVHRLAHHQGQHRLIWMYDLKLLAAALSAADWEKLRDWSCQRRIASFCLDGLRAARDQVGGELPADVESALADASATEPSKVYLEGQVTRSDVLISDLKVLRTWRERLRLLREHVLPSPAFIRQRYGTRTRMMLPAFYLHRLITGASRWVRS